MTIATGRLETALQHCRTAADVAAAVFRTVPAQVPFAFACLATTDPLTGVITWAYKSHPLEIGDEEWAVAEYGAPDVNQFAEIALRPVPVAVLSLDTGGRVADCRRFRDLMTPRFGFTDELRLVLGSRGLSWGALGLYRGAGEEPFTERDAADLAAVRGLVADALRRTLFAGDPVTGDGPEPAVVVVGPTGRPREMTRAARDRIEDLGGWDHGALPAGLLAVAANARASGGVAVSRTRLASGRWLTMRGAVLDGPGESAGVVVTIDVAHPAELSGLTLAGLGLTAREQEIAGLVVKGASTRAIAETLHLSPHTVQDHLKAIFAKLGINSRRQLIAQLYG